MSASGEYNKHFHHCPVDTVLQKIEFPVGDGLTCQPSQDEWRLNVSSIQYCGVGIGVNHKQHFC